jgi:predicted kinase
MCIELLIAAIGSGKSQYALKRAREGAVIVNDDSIVESLHGGDYKLYDKNFKGIYKEVTDQIICSAVSRGLDAVIDRTNLDILRRTRYIQLAKDLSTSIICTCFKIETPEIHAQRRFWHNARGYDYQYWLKVTKEHLRQYTPPSLKEGFSLIRYADYVDGDIILRN